LQNLSVIIPVKLEEGAMYIELSDKQWAAIEQYLPPINYNGRPRANDRRVMNGILYVLKTGCQWPAIPAEYGVHYSTCWRRLKHWEENGVWQRIIQALLEDREAELAEIALDTSSVKAKKGAHAWGAPEGAASPSAA
jgi:transposase